MEENNRRIKGAIVINAFLRPKESVVQAERLKQEFALLGVEVNIVNDDFLLTGIANNSIYSKLSKLDFVLYLNKDKYQTALLEKKGIKLFNSDGAIRVCDDKGITYVALADNGFNLPETVFAPVCYSENDVYPDRFLQAIADRLGFPIIVKESFGSMGKGVYKADDLLKLKEVCEKIKTRPFVFQKCISSSYGKDVRVTVVGGKAIAIMMRENSHDFRSNVGVGGKGVNLNGNDDYKEYLTVAEKLAQFLGLDYCGVDLLVGENNQPIVCEVNSNAFFMETERVTNVNVAKLYAEYIVNTVENNQR